MKTIFDLPAHPLFVHAPLVLLPLIAVVTIVAAVRPGVGRKLGVWLPAATFLVLISIQLAIGSGEALDEATDHITNIRKHASLARTSRLFAFVMLVATTVLWWLRRDRPQADGADGAKRNPLQIGLMVVAVVFAVLGTVWMIRTGHEGARLHWKDVLKTK